MTRKFSMAAAMLVAATGSAFAADLPSRRPPPVFTPVPLFTWTGFYVGGDVGYAWGSDKVSTPTTFGSSASPQGVVGGGHVGYNYQINQFVVGLEGDVSGADFTNNVLLPSGVTAGVRIPIEASGRGRLGYAWDRTLFYVTGGAAIAQQNDFYYVPTPGFLPYYSRTSTRLGWTVGAGVEYALSNNWSVRGEYRYSDFGHQSDVYAGPTVVFNTQHLTEHAVRVGFSYKFDMYAPPAPVVAKY